MEKGKTSFSQTFFIAERRFTLDISRYTNGSLVFLYEDEPRIGSLILSLKGNQNKVTSTSLIPDARGGVLPKMIAEMATMFGNGIILTSTFFKRDFTQDQLKGLLSELRQLMKEGLRSSETT